MPLFGPPNVEKLKARRDVKRLIEALGYEKDRSVPGRAARALGEIGDARAVEPLIAALKHYDKDTRRAAAEALGKLGDPRAVKPLIAVLEDPDREAKKAAAEALGKIGDAQATEPLVSTLKNEFWEALREATAEALSRIGAPAVEPLVDVLEVTEYRLVKLAAKSLARIGSPATQPLISKLKDGSLIARKIAVEVLGEIGDAQAIEPLVAIIRDGKTERSLRETAARALIQLGWKPEQSQTEVWYWVAQRNWEKMTSFGALAIDPLLASLEVEHNAEERKNAAEALARIGKQAVEPLIAALGDERWTVREGAAYALGEIGDSRAIDPLIDAFKDEGWGEHDATAKALKRLGAPLPKPKKLSASAEKKALSALNRLCAAYASGHKAQIAKLEPLGRQIGEEANQRGGMMEMRRLFNKLDESSGRRNLEFLWGGIGRWRG